MQDKSNLLYHILYYQNVWNGSTVPHLLQFFCVFCVFFGRCPLASLRELRLRPGSPQLSHHCRGEEAGCSHNDAHGRRGLCWEWLNLKQLNHKVYPIGSGNSGGYPVIPALSLPAPPVLISPPGHLQLRRNDPKDGEITATYAHSVQL